MGYQVLSQLFYNPQQPQDDFILYFPLQYREDTITTVTSHFFFFFWKWDFRVTEDYQNHGPSLDPSAHNIHRRQTATQQALERNLSKHKALPAREISSILRDSEPDAAFFRIQKSTMIAKRFVLKRLGARQQHKHP